MDEVAMIAKAAGDTLPSRLVDLIDSYDKDFTTFTGDRENFLNRCIKVFEVSASLPDVTTRVNSTELLPTFTLAKKDKDRVLKLCGDMRKIVFASSDFDEPHKKRLLNRIAAIEKQILSPSGLFDVVLGGVSDIGETLGKFGRDIRPLTDRMAEVAKITRKGTKDYDQIPALEEIKKLQAPEDGDEGE